MLTGLMTLVGQSHPSGRDQDAADARQDDDPCDPAEDGDELVGAGRLDVRTRGSGTPAVSHWEWARVMSCIGQSLEAWRRRERRAGE